MSKIGFDIEQLPYCCGAYECGYFKEEGLAAYSDYMSDTPERAIETALRVSEGQPVIFNFYREAVFDDDENVEGYNDKFKCDELREVVRKHPKVIHIGCFKNKNSGNIVDSYVIFTAEDASNV